MESFLDPKVEELLADKSETERLQAIAFSIACLCTGPTPFQPPDYYHIPKRTGKINEIRISRATTVIFYSLSLCSCKLSFIS